MSLGAYVIYILRTLHFSYGSIHETQNDIAWQWETAFLPYFFREIDKLFHSIALIKY
jgi:hypothetical protein